MKTDFRALCAELTDQLHQYAEVFPEHKIEPLVERARAALTQSGAKESTVLARVEFAEREFNFPSDVVLRQYCDDWFYSDPERSEVDPVDLCRGAIKLFAQAPTPIPVTERLPGPEDCLPRPGEPDETHWCWVFVKGSLGDDAWERRPVTCLTAYRSIHTHWLPAHALPLPEVE